MLNNYQFWHNRLLYQSLIELFAIKNFISFLNLNYIMIFKLKSKGHKNVTSLHKSTFEVTKDAEIGPTADCIIGTGADQSMLNFPEEFKEKIADSNTKITVILDTENGHDEINGFGHENLTLTHPTDIVCRTSDFTCSRTLMIRADKAARDLDKDLIEDLKNEKIMEVTIKLA